MLIDYPLVSPKERIVFFILRLSPVFILTLSWFISFSKKIELKHTASIATITMMITMTYRPGNDLSNFLILNTACIILLAALPLFQLKMISILSIFYIASNALVYFLFYHSTVHLENSGLAILLTLSFVYFLILKVRHDSVKKNFLRSQQLILQNTQIKEKTLRLENLHITIQNKSKTLKQAYNSLEESNNALLESLDYARELQQLLLPKQQEIKKYFNDFFIFFRPLNRVSGDFYWFSPIKDGVIIVTMDCTGHGVPGALVSMIGDALLKRIILDQETYNPKDILDKMHQGIRQTLKQDENSNRDGMDLGLVYINQIDQKLYFAGANNPLIYFQEQKMKIIKGDLFSIGGEQRVTGHVFTQKELDISQDTTFYLFTDGFQDQFGEKTEKKFMRHRFREMLEKVHTLPMQEQKMEIIKTLNKWQGNHFQVDDILVMGFHIQVK